MIQPHKLATTVTDIPYHGPYQPSDKPVCPQCTLSAHPGQPCLSGASIMGDYAALDTENVMKVYCVFIDNGDGEADSLVEIYATQEQAEACISRDNYPGYLNWQEWEVTS